jgi:hypothetical protein
MHVYVGKSGHMGVLPAGKMAVLDVGAATPEQLQALKQHPALKQAFTVHVSRQAALKAGLTASGSPDAAIDQALANLQVTQDAVTAEEGLIQVRAHIASHCQSALCCDSICGRLGARQKG